MSENIITNFILYNRYLSIDFENRIIKKKIKIKFSNKNILQTKKLFN